MNEKVQKYLEEQKNKAKYDENNVRTKTLIEAGLYEKVYSPNNTYSDVYNESEYGENNVLIYFRKVPIEVTDEEFAEIKRYSEGEYDKNKIATLINIIAVFIIAVCFIAGIIVGNSVSRYEFDTLSALIYWIAGAIAGSMFFGFAEIINLLNKINNK